MFHKHLLYTFPFAKELPCSAFYVDDTMNGFLADWFGIVMGTSHEEPMARSIPVEWNLFGVGQWDYSTNADFIYQFWVNSTERAKNYETLYTIGMRGNGDCECLFFFSVGCQSMLILRVFSLDGIESAALAGW
jgi:hypothetical protein